MRHTILFFLYLAITELLGGCERTAVLQLCDGTYQGETHDGRPQGYGDFVSADRHISYSGEWYRGRKNGYGRWQCGDSLYEGFFRNDSMNGQGRLRYPNGTRYQGAWKNNRRHGYGEQTDCTGTVYRGIWDADSLSRGDHSDSAGIYTGSFDTQLRRTGDGCYITPDGSYYLGQWSEDLRHGWGFAVEPYQVVKCGTWHNGRFQGEQILYNPERVYGIDISKYQHGSPHKPRSIQWKDLRITHLGTISKKRIQNDKTDYPVSFVYIKASQGTRITNRFYLSDIRQARKYGYERGAYHFFSTQPGVAQASHFLRTARPQKGDLPPMLDVELSDKQIEQMGGAKAMFREIILWMKEVEERVHTRPILYVSQSFVNDYLPQAPRELQEDYHVWVARYGAYKPYVHLLYWQLSPDGQVKGIQGRVDLNVYNGTKEQFKQYVRQGCVR